VSGQGDGEREEGRPGWRALCPLAELVDGETRGFPLGPEHGLFIVHRAGRVYAYRNRCPHTGGPLEWLPDRFLDPSGQYIQCALHGALFHIEDGACVYGPCDGRGLEPLPVEVREGTVGVSL
jgi:nitrite reductase/ring-hydroxylating ferredoxin subunit